MTSMINNKKGIRFDHILIGFILMAIVVIIGVMMITDMNNNYQKDDNFPDDFESINLSDDGLDGVYDKIDEVYGIGKDAKEDTFDADISSGTESWESMTTGSYSAVRLVSGAAPIFLNMTSAVSSHLGVPPILVNAAYTIFMIAIVFSIVYMIFRFIPR